MMVANLDGVEHVLAEELERLLDPAVAVSVVELADEVDELGYEIDHAQASHHVQRTPLDAQYGRVDELMLLRQLLLLLLLLTLEEVGEELLLGVEEAVDEEEAVLGYELAVDEQQVAQLEQLVLARRQIGVEVLDVERVLLLLLLLLLLFVLVVAGARLAEELDEHELGLVLLEQQADEAILVGGAELGEQLEVKLFRFAGR